MSERPLDELVDAADPAMPMIRDWIAKAPHPVELLPAMREDGERVLRALQVTTRSTLGALAYETGGLRIDRGWLRVLGAGAPRLPRDLARWNRLPGEPRLHGALLIADDVVGGFFALDGGAFSGPRGNVHYFAPDSLVWEDTGWGYSDWLHWAVTGDLAGYYESTRWPGWEREVEPLDGDRVLSIVPPVWAQGESIAARDRRPVPIDELFELYVVGGGSG